eukprot:c8659_g1_i3.p1 GENE.c8659_g1_i3~~c8659_g1_i3.p1  ORF type:complete len:225 (-),score=67.89 c8659_g1_i3:56-730(-)
MFHLQEKVRFLNPETPFQYFVDGLRFNVGPCVALDTNIDTQQEQQSKHVILRSSRPKAVTITNIVRDAVCRLREPGSHIQIMQLVLQSQYIKPECDQRLLGILINFSLHQLKQAGIVESNAEGMFFPAPAKYTIVQGISFSCTDLTKQTARNDKQQQSHDQNLEMRTFDRLYTDPTISPPPTMATTTLSPPTTAAQIAIVATQSQTPSTIDEEPHHSHVGAAVY